MPMYNYFPQTYQSQMYPQQMQGGYNQQITQTQTPQQGTTQIQQSGFIPVPSEEVARNYPVAPGNSVSFKNENAPYVYVKTMGYSPLDMPTFEKFRLVKEDSVPEVRDDSIDMSNYTLKSDFDDLKSQFEEFKRSLEV